LRRYREGEWVEGERERGGEWVEGERERGKERERESKCERLFRW
jgi:hypothetical protein